MIPTAGEEALLQALFQGVDTNFVAAGANLYLGLCNQTPVKTDVMTDISTEPSVANGYARKAIVRSAVGFPTIEQVNGESRIVSLVLTFTAAGGDFSASFTRAFLCTSASGSTGTLLAYSGAYATPILLADGQSQQLKFEFYP